MPHERPEGAVAYCFKGLNLHRVYARVSAHNEPSISMCRRYGFQPEGVMRQAIFDEGQYRDVLLMSLLAPEYVQSP